VKDLKVVTRRASEAIKPLLELNNFGGHALALYDQFSHISRIQTNSVEAHHATPPFCCSILKLHVVTMILGLVKPAICNEIFQDWKLEDVVSYSTRTGYAGIEIAPFTLANSVNDISKEERRRIRDLAARYGVEIVGLHWLLAKPEGLHVNHPDSSVRASTAGYLCDLVNFCADVGGGLMVVGSPKQRHVLPGVSVEQARLWTIQTLRDAVKRAEDRAVTICIEPLSPTETNFINTAADAIAQIIRDSWPHFAHFHANDRNLRWPGSGDVDFVPIATALKEVGYSGFVSVEVFKFDEGAETIAVKSMEYLKRVFA
jgi:sugar phosphate isomerase/epimerase